MIAVEPSQGMREGWEKKQKEVDLKESGIKVSIQDGLFDKIPVGDAQADLVRPRRVFNERYSS